MLKYVFVISVLISSLGFSQRNDLEERIRSLESKSREGDYRRNFVHSEFYPDGVLKDIKEYSVDISGRVLYQNWWEPERIKPRLVRHMTFFRNGWVKSWNNFGKKGDLWEYTYLEFYPSGRKKMMGTLFIDNKKYGKWDYYNDDNENSFKEEKKYGYPKEY